MTLGYRALFGFQTAVVEHWARSVCTVVKSYVALLDPRPDLAIPARSVQRAYAWWW
jgi:hypothetical protein